MASINQKHIDTLRKHEPIKNNPLTAHNVTRWCYICGEHCTQYVVKSYELELYCECSECKVRIYNVAKFHTYDCNKNYRVGNTTARHQETVLLAYPMDENSLKHDSGESCAVLDNLTYYIDSVLAQDYRDSLVNG